MKQNVKVFVIALILGIAIAVIYNKKFDNTLMSWAKESKVGYFYIGAYNDLKLAQEKKSKYKNQAVIFNDDGIYKVVIGVYTNKEVESLMARYWQDLGQYVQKGELKVEADFLKKLETYEILIKSSAKSYYENVNNSLLNLFSEYIS